NAGSSRLIWVQGANWFTKAKPGSYFSREISNSLPAQSAFSPTGLIWLARWVLRGGHLFRKSTRRNRIVSRWMEFTKPLPREQASQFIQRRRLGASGGDVTVYCRNYFTPDIAGHAGMRLVRLPTIRSKHLETLIHTFLSTLHVCFSRRCDIVHYHCLGPALFSFLPRIFGKKTVVTVQGLDWKRKKWGRIASAALRCGEKASARFPDATVVVSRTPAALPAYTGG